MDETERRFAIVMRLMKLAPEYTLADASDALDKIEEGDWHYIAERYNVSRRTAEAWCQAVRDGEDVFDVLDAGLREIGV